MITSTRYKSGLYDELFQKAGQRLLDAGIVIDAPIESLEEYFANLKTIVYLKDEIISTSNEQELQDRFYYLRLPLDEPPIWIDANTRTISKKIEDSGYGAWENGEYKEYKKGSNHPFFTNGIAVQGDEVAEIIYFEIDRFFDATDLSLMDIAVQWIHEEDLKGAGDPYYRYTPIVIKDIESNPGKLIFGWPISSDITNRSGKINFSIRFYRIDGNQIIYSLSTQTQSVAVNPTILANIEDGYSAIDNQTSLILGRLQNSIFKGYNDPDIPIFILLNPNSEDNIGIGKEIESITEDMNLYMLYQATSGQLSYRWVLEPLTFGNEQQSPIELSSFTKLSIEDFDTDTTGYLKINEYNSNIVNYYQKTEDNKYKMIQILGETDFNTALNTTEELYIRCAVLKFENVIQDLCAGKIKVDVKNTYYDKEVVLSAVNEEEYNNYYWEIIGPQSIPENSFSIDESYNLSDEAVPEILLSYNSNSNIDENTHIIWYNENNEEEALKNGEGIIREGLDKYPLADLKEGYYKASLYNYKNNTSAPIVNTNSTFVYEPLEEFSFDSTDNLECVADENGYLEIKVTGFDNYLDNPNNNMIVKFSNFLEIENSNYRVEGNKLKTDILASRYLDKPSGETSIFGFGTIEIIINKINKETEKVVSSVNYIGEDGYYFFATKE